MVTQDVGMAVGLGSSVFGLSNNLPLLHFSSVHTGLADSFCACGVLVYIHTLQNVRRDKEQQQEGRRGPQASLSLSHVNKMMHERGQIFQ